MDEAYHVTVASVLKDAATGWFRRQHLTEVLANTIELSPAVERLGREAVLAAILSLTKAEFTVDLVAIEKLAGEIASVRQASHPEITAWGRPGYVEDLAVLFPSDVEVREESGGADGLNDGPGWTRRYIYCQTAAGRLARAWMLEHPEVTPAEAMLAVADDIREGEPGSAEDVEDHLHRMVVGRVDPTLPEWRELVRTTAIAAMAADPALRPLPALHLGLAEARRRVAAEAIAKAARAAEREARWQASLAEAAREKEAAKAARAARYAARDAAQQRSSTGGAPVDNTPEDLGAGAFDALNTLKF